MVFFFFFNFRPKRWAGGAGLFSPYSYGPVRYSNVHNVLIPLMISRLHLVSTMLSHWMSWYSKVAFLHWPQSPHLLGDVHTIFPFFPAVITHTTSNLISLPHYHAVFIFVLGEFFCILILDDTQNPHNGDSAVWSMWCFTWLALRACCVCCTNKGFRLNLKIRCSKPTQSLFFVCSFRHISQKLATHCFILPYPYSFISPSLSKLVFADSFPSFNNTNSCFKT